MKEIDGIIKFAQSPLGQMLFNGGKDFVTNHLFPFAKMYMAGAMRPVNMDELEREYRAQEEFATVDEFDINGDVENSEIK